MTTNLFGNIYRHNNDLLSDESLSLRSQEMLNLHKMQFLRYFRDYSSRLPCIRDLTTRLQLLYVNIARKISEKTECDLYHQSFLHSTPEHF